MISAGIDIGSRYIKFVLAEDGNIIAAEKKETGHDPLGTCHKIIAQFIHKRPERIVATGYGRYLLEVHGDIHAITEIKAVAKGAKAVFSSCRTVIDIGGQDTKVISLNGDGMVAGFEMNDRCAAGTGRFLEIMARTLGFSIEEFGRLRRSNAEGDGRLKINSMCTVFAESEVVGLIARGVSRDDITAAIHDSIAGRVMSLVRRVGADEEIVFAGGCAMNESLALLLAERLQKPLKIGERPDMLAALGAALYAAG
ncbi:MAG TPA: acyl-CoA dehydratase activase [Dissulfurispiraceae bacterium]|nr:acyl-CoA dehydratase activase [Dissulfurispiraceae bacterium]